MYTGPFSYDVINIVAGIKGQDLPRYLYNQSRIDPFSLFNFLLKKHPMEMYIIVSLD